MAREMTRWDALDITSAPEERDAAKGWADGARTLLSAGMKALPDAQSHSAGAAPREAIEREAARCERWAEAARIYAEGCTAAASDGRPDAQMLRRAALRAAANADGYRARAAALRKGLQNLAL